MVNRAVDDDSPEGIVDLVNDDRWQARLEEARARREVALREKGKDPDAAPKRKPMPWEVEANKTPTIDPVVQDPETDRVDFADRVDKVRETVTADEKPPKEPRRAVSKSKPRPVSRRGADAASTSSVAETPYDNLIEDTAFDLEAYDDEDWAPPPKKRPSAIHEGAPDVIELATRYASTLTPGANAGSVDVFEEAAQQDPVAAPVVVARNHPPALLIVGVLLLAAMPLAQAVPPLERGPQVPALEPSLRLQPALGFTTAMLWRPGETSSSDWRPPTTWSLPLGTVFSPQTPNIQTGSNGLVSPRVGQTSPEFTAPVSATIAPRSAQPAVLAPLLDGASVDRLPGAFSRRPAARPLEGEPITNIRAPSRPPDVATGNETSPRVAPVSDPDSSLLDQVTALSSVIFERAPLIAEQARDALRVPGRSLDLTILVPTRAEEQVATQFAQDATRRGHSIASIKEVNVSISTRNMRYFHQADRAEAERLAKIYGAEVRSFTWFTPKPSAGTVELWLEGRAVAPAVVPRAAPVVRNAPVVEPPAPEPTIVVVRKEQGFLSRLLGGHVVGAFNGRGEGSSGDGASASTPRAPSGPSGTGGADTGSATGAGTTSGGTSGSGTSDTGGTDTAGSDTGSSDTGGNTNAGNSSGSSFGGNGSPGNSGGANSSASEP